MGKTADKIDFLKTIVFNDKNGMGNTPLNKWVFDKVVDILPDDVWDNGAKHMLLATYSICSEKINGSIHAKDILTCQSEIDSFVKSFYDDIVDELLIIEGFLPYGDERVEVTREQLIEFLYCSLGIDKSSIKNKFALDVCDSAIVDMGCSIDYWIDCAYYKDKLLDELHSSSDFYKIKDE